MSPRADEPSPGETRAERRRRRQAAQWGGLPEPSAAFDARPAGPYDPHPYGVRAYPDIEDAVLEEYVEDTVPPAQYQAQPYAGATRPPEPPRADDGRWRADPPAAYGDGGYGDGDYGDELTPAAPAVEAPTAPVEPDPAPAAWGDPALGAEPIRHVAHRAYGGAAPRPEIASTPHTPSADLTQPEVGTPEYGTTQAGPTGSSTTPSGLTQSGTADQLGRPTAAAPVESAAAPLDPAEAASAAAPSPGPLAASPLVGDDAGLDPAKEADAHALLEAAWAREGVNSFSPAIWHRLWENPDYRIRSAALRILSHRWKVFPEAMKVLEKAVADENAQVRLWALAVLAEMRKPAAIGLALKILDHPMDDSLDFLLEHGLIHKLERLNAYIGCVDAGHGHAHDHHHPHQFLICRTCGTTVEIADHGVAHAIESAARGAGFHLVEATVEIEGICARCAAA